MCTVSIVSLPGRNDGAFRVAANRDELRTRGPARPPETAEYGHRRAIHPVDADAGGTWIGVNDAGLVLSLLNLNLDPAGDPAPAAPAAGARSRGAIIMDLLHHDAVRDALADARHIDPAAQRPFRLVLVDRAERAVVRSDGRTLRVTHAEPNRGAFMITSSGLGDHLVEGPRRARFEALFGRPSATADPVATQDAFHRSHDAAAGGVSVSMDRPDALTVSHTLVEVAGDQVAMSYLDGPPHAASAEARRAAAARLIRLDRRARTAG
jgi:hypothetical protein